MSSGKGSKHSTKLNTKGELILFAFVHQFARIGDGLWAMLADLCVLLKVKLSRRFYRAPLAYFHQFFIPSGCSSCGQFSGHTHLLLIAFLR